MTGPHPAGRALRKLKSKTLRVFVVRCLGVASLFALDVTLARRLGVSDFGVFAFVLGVATATSHLAPLGWQNVSTRLVRIYSDANEPSLLKGSLIAAHGATAVGLLGAGLILAIVFLPGGRGDGTLVVQLALPLAVGLTAIELHRYVLRGQHASTLGEALPMLVLPVCVLGAVWILKIDSTASVVLAFVATCVLLLVLSSVWIALRLPGGTARVRADYRLRTWSGMAFAMLLGTASDEVVARSSILVLGTVSTSESVGLYHSALRLALLTVFVLRAVTAASAPRMAELHRVGDLSRLRSEYLRACLISGVCALPFLLVFGAFPDFGLRLFGQGFVEAAPLLRILTIGYFVSAAAGPSATGLMMIGREKIYGTVAVAAAGVNIVGLLIAVPRYDALGAAVVSATVIAVVKLCYAAAMLHATVEGRGGATRAGSREGRLATP